MSFYTDDCLTGSEAVERALIAHRKRMESRKVRPPRPDPEDRPRPVEVVEEVKPVWVYPEPPASAPPPSPPILCLPPARKMLIRAIVDEVAAYFNLTAVEMFSERRAQGIVRPRFIAMYLAWKMTPYGFPMIGKALGGRDHSTVVHGKDRIVALVAAKDAKTIKVLNEIAAIIDQKCPVAPDAEEEPLTHAQKIRLHRELYPRGMKTWTSVERQRLETLVLELRTAKFIAHELGRSVSAIKHECRRLALPAVWHKVQAA